MSVLPRQLNYLSTKSRATAGNNLVSVHPDSGTSFNCGDNLTFRLPVNGAGRYLDTDSIQIKFKIENHSAKAFHLNSTASCFINRKVEAQTGVLSDITNYNVLSELVLDAQCSDAQRVSSMSVLAGAQPHYTSVGAVGQTTRKGDSVGNAVSGVPGEREVQIGLIGGLLANSTQRYVPLSLSSPLTLQLYLESAARAVVWGAGTTAAECANTLVKLTGWEMFYNVVSLDSATNAMLVNSSPVQSIMVDDYINAQTQIPQGITSHSPIIPFQKSSLKSMFVCMFDQVNQQNQLSYCLNNRTRAQISSFQMNVDGSVRPSRPISCSATSSAGEFYQNFLNGFHITPGSLHQVSFSKAEWTKVMESTDADDLPGAFAIAYDLDSYMGLSETTYGGLNSLSSTVSPMLGFNPATANNLSVQHFGMFDSVISCDTTTGILSLAS